MRGRAVPTMVWSSAANSIARITSIIVIILRFGCRSPNDVTSGWSFGFLILSNIGTKYLTSLFFWRRHLSFFKYERELLGDDDKCLDFTRREPVHESIHVAAAMGSEPGSEPFTVGTELETDDAPVGYIGMTLHQFAAHQGID